MIQEYLIVKQEQTEHLLKSIPKKNPGRKGLSNERWSLYEEIYSKIRKLNERKAA